MAFGVATTATRDTNLRTSRGRLFVSLSPAMYYFLPHVQRVMPPPSHASPCSSAHVGMRRGTLPVNRVVCDKEIRRLPPPPLPEVRPARSGRLVSVSSVSCRRDLKHARRRRRPRPPSPALASQRTGLLPRPHHPVKALPVHKEKEFRKRGFGAPHSAAATNQHTVCSRAVPLCVRRQGGTQVRRARIWWRG